MSHKIKPTKSLPSDHMCSADATVAALGLVSLGATARPQVQPAVARQRRAPPTTKPVRKAKICKKRMAILVREGAKMAAFKQKKVDAIKKRKRKQQSQDNLTRPNLMLLYPTRRPNRQKLRQRRLRLLLPRARAEHGMNFSLK